VLNNIAVKFSIILVSLIYAKKGEEYLDVALMWNFWRITRLNVVVWRTDYYGKLVYKTIGLLASLFDTCELKLYAVFFRQSRKTGAATARKSVLKVRTDFQLGLNFASLRVLCDYSIEDWT